MQGTDHFWDTGIDGKTISKCILEKEVVKFWTE
jgi:hypothetical protein